MQRVRVIPKFLSIRYNLSPTFRINKGLTKSNFAILRAVTQDVKQPISSIEPEVYSLHFHLSNYIRDLSSFEKKDF